MAELFGIPSQTLRLKLALSNGPDETIRMDEVKIFILDNKRRQVQLIPFEQMKYDDEQLMAQMRALIAPADYGSVAATPPLAPPAPTRYRITGTSDGSYTLTPMGTDSAMVTGTSEGTYTVEPEYSPGQQISYGVESLADTIRRIRITRQNARQQQIIQQENEMLLNDIRDLKETLSWWEKEHFDTTRLIAPGETRSGTIVFRPSEANDLSTVKAIIYLSDGSTGREEFVTFRFQY